MSKKYKVVKRNGSTVEFDASKIEIAIQKSFCEAKKIEFDKNSIDEKVKQIASIVVSKLFEKFPNKSSIPIGDINNEVEYALMSESCFDTAKAYILHRSNKDKRATISDSSKELSEFIINTKYARYLPEKKRRETWDEIVDRVQDMHSRRYAKFLQDPERHDLNLIWEQTFDAIRRKEILPAGRHLQFAGQAIEKNNCRGYNCSGTLIDREEAFAEILFLLLSGCGVGFSVQKHHVAKMPEFPKRKSNEELKVKHHTVEDTIEGWSDAVNELFISYREGYYVEFNYSSIRDKGSPLKTSGGKAPGHLGLKHSIEKIREILDWCEGRKMKPIEAYDIVCWIADCVLSGGIRRSACICLFSPDDEEMRTAKIGEWWKHSQHRMNTNNSVVLVRGKTTKEEFDRCFEEVKTAGEPGFVFLNSTENVVNPCAEITFLPKITIEDVEETTFSFCNLTTINVASCTSNEDFYHRCRCASFLGTLQAGYTNFKYISPAANELAERDSLIGVSLCGIMDNPKIGLNKTTLELGALAVKETNKVWAKEFGLNPSKRSCAVKPEGTASLVFGCGSGIHPIHSKKYIRRVRLNKDEQIYRYILSTSPESVEQDKQRTTDAVVSFPITAREGAITKQEISALSFLENVKLVQKAWVVSGTDDKSGLINNVSNTCSVKENEWDDVREFLWKNRNTFTGVSLFPDTGDTFYIQAPLECVCTESQEEMFCKCKMKPVDFSKVIEEDDNTKLAENAACHGGTCEIR